MSSRYAYYEAQIGPRESILGFAAPQIGSLHPRDVAQVCGCGCEACSLIIGHGTLAKSQLPDQITKPDGFILRRPNEWR